MIDIKGLTFAYSGWPPIFDRFDLTVKRGEALAVIGPSGCGKSTLLYLLAGLLSPESGSICINRVPLVRPRPRTGLVLQDHGLLPWSTVAQNIRLGLDIWKFYGSDGKHAPTDKQVDPQQAEKRVTFWLQKLGLEGFRDQYPARLSRGQRQRTAIARTLVLQPDLMLLDEPFSALDAPTREDLQKTLITQHRESNLSYIIVTHDIEVAVVMGQKIMLLSRGANHRSPIIENDCALKVEHRHQAEFHDRCEELRQLLGERHAAQA